MRKNENIIAVRVDPWVKFLFNHIVKEDNKSPGLLLSMMVSYWASQLYGKEETAKQIYEYQQAELSHKMALKDNKRWRKNEKRAIDRQVVSSLDR